MTNGSNRYAKLIEDIFDQYKIICEQPYPI